MSKPDDVNAGQGNIEVQTLLAEVNALAGELRKPGALGGGESWVPAGERSILQALGESGPQTVPGIARARGSSRQSVQMLVNRLESRGWVELVSNPAHQRSRLVCLTARGKGLLAEVMEQEAVAWEPRFEGISAVGVRRACAMLRRIRHALTGQAPRSTRTVSRTGSGKSVVAPKPALPSEERMSGERVPALAVEESPTTGLARTEAVAAPASIGPEPEEFPISLL